MPLTFKSHIIETVHTSTLQPAIVSWYIVSTFPFFSLSLSLKTEKKQKKNKKQPATTKRPCAIRRVLVAMWSTTELVYFFSLPLCREGNDKVRLARLRGMFRFNWDIMGYIRDCRFPVRAPCAFLGLKYSFIKYTCHRHVAFANALKQTITWAQCDMQYIESSSNSWLVEQLALMSCWSAGLRSMFPFIKCKLHICLNQHRNPGCHRASGMDYWWIWCTIYINNSDLNVSWSVWVVKAELSAIGSCVILFIYGFLRRKKWKRFTG